MSFVARIHRDVLRLQDLRLLVSELSSFLKIVLDP